MTLTSVFSSASAVLCKATARDSATPVACDIVNYKIFIANYGRLTLSEVSPQISKRRSNRVILNVATRN